ncbi:MAG: hypothetical protein N2235_23070 [Fischerella sp.]|nr:hypothetical protein [Fischerella sp.]
MPGTLRVKQNTTFKQVWELQSSELQQIPKNYTYIAQQGAQFPTSSIQRYEDAAYQSIVNQTTGEKLRDYWYVQFKAPINGSTWWYVYKPHVEEI